MASGPSYPTLRRRLQSGRASTNQTPVVAVAPATTSSTSRRSVVWSWAASARSAAECTPRLARAARKMGQSPSPRKGPRADRGLGTQLPWPVHLPRWAPVHGVVARLLQLRRNQLCSAVAGASFSSLPKLPLELESDESEDEESALMGSGGWRCSPCKKQRLQRSTDNPH